MGYYFKFWDVIQTKSTPLIEQHRALNARLAPFAGYEMPISYTSIKQEHMAVRESAGMFDVSHMGEFFISGPQAKDLVQWVSSNNVEDLFPGRIQYSCLMNASGGIVDDMLVYCLSETSYMLVVNASNIDKDFKWIESQNSFECELTNKSDEYALLAVQGPKATSILQKLSDADLSAIPFYHFGMGSFAGFENVLLSNTGYTGSGGFEIYLSNDQAIHAWKEVLRVGADEGIQPVGLAARDTLRLEMGYCLYGNDISDESTPLEAGLGWITKLDNNDFIGKDALLSLKENGLKKKLVGFEMLERGIPRQGYDILDAEGEVIGTVTSGTQSPCLEKGIGMGYVYIDHSKRGSKISIAVRSKSLAAKIVRLPFYKKK